MRSTLQRLIWLYPKAWRERYQDEFEVLLDDVSPTWKTFFDVLGGALKMQMKSGTAWKIVAACGLAGALAAGAFTLTIPKYYVSTAVIHSSEEQLVDAIQGVESRGSLTSLIVEQNLYPSERARIPIEDVVEHMKRYDINVRLVGGQAFTVSFASADAGQAQRTTQRLASQLVDRSNGTMVDPATLPVVPVGPRLSKNLVLGLIAGMVLGSLFALFAGLKVWKPAAGLGVAGAVAGAAIGYLIPDRYSSVAILRCVTPDQGAAGDRARQLYGVVTSEDSLQAIVRKFNLYPGESGREGKLREHLHLQVVGKAPAFMIQFDDKDRYMAQKVNGDVVSRFMEAAVRGGLELRLELLDPPSLPMDAYFPNRGMVVGTGLFIGLAGAVGLGLWRYFRGAVREVAAR